MATLSTGFMLLQLLDASSCAQQNRVVFVKSDVFQIYDLNARDANGLLTRRVQLSYTILKFVS